MDSGSATRTVGGPGATPPQSAGRKSYRAPREGKAEWDNSGPSTGSSGSTGSAGSTGMLRSQSEKLGSAGLGVAGSGSGSGGGSDKVVSAKLSSSKEHRGGASSPLQVAGEAAARPQGVISSLRSGIASLLER